MASQNFKQVLQKRHCKKNRKHSKRKFCNWQLATYIDAFKLSMIISLEPKPNIKNFCVFFQKEALIASIENCKQIKCVFVCVFIY